MRLYLIVAAGGAIGSILRFGLNGLISDAAGPGFPWGTLIINITGSLLIGFISTLTDPHALGRWLPPAGTREFLMVGVCGGYTTFSSFSLQTLNLMQGGEWFKAAANVVLSVLLCMIGVWGGYALAMLINKGHI
jgi:CrcB protein